MSRFSTRTKLYVLGAILTGTLLALWHLADLRLQQVWLLIALGGLAAVTHILKVEGPTAKSSYQISLMVYGFTMLLLGPPAAVAVLLIAHIVEWAWHRYPWYIQAFNIGAFVITVSAAGLVYRWINPTAEPLGAAGALATLGATAAFTLVNHFLVGLVLKLARGESFAASGVFEALPLLMDFSLFGMGAGAALIWLVNPYAIVLVVFPLYLIYSTLKIPALQRRSQTDPKTGVYNSQHFRQVFAGELARANRFDRPLTVVLADLDLLRNINNTYGHLAGDQVLIGVAKILRESVRDYDVVARFGGEEFAILMPEVAPQQALARVEAMRSAIQKARFDIPTSVTPIQTTMSFGIAGREKFGQSADDILHNADVALYHSKLQGRNRAFIFADDSIQNLFEVEKAEPPTPPNPSPAAAQKFGSETAAPAALPARPQPAPEVLPPRPTATPVTRRRPPWLPNFYIASVALAAAGLLAFTARPTTSDWLGLALFALVVLLTEGLSIEIYAKDASVSTAATAFIAGVLLFGPAGLLALSLVQAAAALIKHRSHFSRFVFNAANQVIAGTLVLEMISLTGRAFFAWPPLAQGVLSLLAAGVVYIVTTSLVAVAIDFSSGQPFRQVWSERFAWLAPYYLAMGAVAFALVFGYQSAGPVGVLAILVPLLMLRLSQAQYVERTKAMASDLRSSNQELARRSGEILILNEELLSMLAHAIDLRDPHVLGHSQQVTRYAVAVAKELGLPAERVELVRKAGLLHDIGKLGISESILFKPAPLTKSEYLSVQHHTTLGADSVALCHSLQTLTPIIRHHHERFDGNGYPDRLRGQDIPLEARILSLADAIEAMASDRPYRKAMPTWAILEEIRQHASTQFDPAVVDAFGRFVEKEGESAIVNSARLPESNGAAMAARGWPIHSHLPGGAPLAGAVSQG